MHKSALTRNESILVGVVVILLIGLALSFFITPQAQQQPATPTTITITRTITQQPTPPTGPIKIGMQAVLTGEESDLGEGARNAALMAIEEINAGGGVLGRRLELIAYDDGGEVEQSLAVVRKLIQDDKVDLGLMASHTDLTIPTATLFEDARILTLVPLGVSDIDAIKESKYIFRMQPLGDIPGQAMAFYAFQQLGKRNIGLLHADDVFNTNVANGFEETFKQLGGSITSRVAFPFGEKEFTSYLTRLRQGEPDGFFVAANGPDFALAVKQARALGMEQVFLTSTAAVLPEIFPIGGEALEQGEGVAMLSMGALDNTQTVDFTQRYIAKFGIPPTFISALPAYDSIYLFAFLIRACPTLDSDCMTRIISEIRNYHGVTGTIIEFKGRDAIYKLPVLTVEDGQFKTVTTIDTRELPIYMIL